MAVTNVFWIENTTIKLVDDLGTSLTFSQSNIKVTYSKNTKLKTYTVNNKLYSSGNAFTVRFDIDFRNIFSADRSDYTGLIDMISGCTSSLSEFITIFPSYDASSDDFLQASFNCFPVGDIKIKNIHKFLDKGSVVSASFEGISPVGISKFPVDEITLLVDESGNYVVDENTNYIEG